MFYPSKMFIKNTLNTEQPGWQKKQKRDSTGCKTSMRIFQVVTLTALVVLTFITCSSLFSIQRAFSSTNQVAAIKDQTPFNNKTSVEHASADSQIALRQEMLKPMELINIEAASGPKSVAITSTQLPETRRLDTSNSLQNGPGITDHGASPASINNILPENQLREAIRREAAKLQKENEVLEEFRLYYEEQKLRNMGKPNEIRGDQDQEHKLKLATQSKQQIPLARDNSVLQIPIFAPFISAVTTSTGATALDQRNVYEKTLQGTFPPPWFQQTLFKAGTIVPAPIAQQGFIYPQQMLTQQIQQQPRYPFIMPQQLLYG